MVHLKKKNDRYKIQWRHAGIDGFYLKATCRNIITSKKIEVRSTIFLAAQTLDSLYIIFDISQPVYRVFFFLDLPYVKMFLVQNRAC